MSNISCEREKERKRTNRQKRQDNGKEKKHNEIKDLRLKRRKKDKSQNVS